MSLYGLYPRIGAGNGLYGNGRFLAHANYAPVYTRNQNSPYATYTLGAGVNFYGPNDNLFNQKEGEIKNQNEIKSPSSADNSQQNPLVKSTNDKEIKSQLSDDKFTPQTKEAKLLNMQYLFESAKNEQGIVGKAIDKIKGFTNIGLSSKTCEAYINAAKNGIMNTDLAYNLVSEYSAKQKNAINTITGISAAILAGALFKGKMEPKAIMAALGGAASIKAGFKAFDRATNNIKGDSLAFSNVARDSLQGVLNGAIGMGASAFINSPASYNSLSSALIKGSLKSGGAGAVGGAVIGAGDYALEASFDKNNKFNKKHFLEAVAYSAAAGGAAGLVAGGIKNGKKYFEENPKVKEEAQNTIQQEQKEVKPEKPGVEQLENKETNKGDSVNSEKPIKQEKPSEDIEPKQLSEPKNNDADSSGAQKKDELAKDIEKEEKHLEQAEKQKTDNSSENIPTDKPVDKPKDKMPSEETVDKPKDKMLSDEPSVLKTEEKPELKVSSKAETAEEDGNFVKNVIKFFGSK